MYLGTPSEGNTTFAEPGANQSVGERLAATFAKPSSGSLMGEDENTPDNARLTGAYQELVSASAEQARLAGHLSSRSEAMADAADIRIKTVQSATGVQLNNPFRQGYYLEAQQRYDDARGRGEDVGPRAEYVNREQLNIFNEKVDAAASNHPEPLTFTPLSEWATSLATGAEGRANFARADLAAAGGGAVNTFAAELAGGLYGSRRDPVSIVSLLAGPGAAAGRTVLSRVAVSAMSQGFFNLGIMALERPEVRAWRDARGQDPGSVLPSAGEVGMAFAMGAIPGAGIQGAIEAKGAAALKRVIAGEASVGEIRTAADALGQKLDADTVATLQAGERANQAAAVAHDPLPGATPAADDAAAQALRHAADPAEPPAPLVPVVPGERSAVAERASIKWDRTTTGEGKTLVGSERNQTVIDVDPQALDAAFKATSRSFYDLPRGPMESLKEHVAAGGEVSIPEVALTVGNRPGRIDFINGRHRARLAAEMHLDTIPVAVDRGQEGAFRDLLSNYAPPDAAAHMDKFATDPLAGVAEMRGNPALVESALASRDPSLQGAAKLATLSDQAFGMVRDGKASAEHGAIVADYAANGADHAAALDRVTKADPKTLDEARAIVADTVEGLAQRREAQALADRMAAETAGREMITSLTDERVARAIRDIRPLEFPNLIAPGGKPANTNARPATPRVPAQDDIFEILRAVRDGENPAVAHARMERATEDQIAGLQEVVAGKTDAELRSIAFGVAHPDIVARGEALTQAPPGKTDIMQKVPLAREDGSVIMAGRDALANVGERENFLADLVGACK